jgi:hypothetical protein
VWRQKVSKARAVTSAQWPESINLAHLAQAAPCIFRLVRQSGVLLPDEGVALIGRHRVEAGAEVAVGDHG